MKDVSAKPETLRRARAEAVLRAPEEAADRALKGEAEKGDPLEVARIGGITAAKKTPDLIPFCHPLPVTHADVRFERVDAGIRVETEVACVGPTGVEMEALTAASTAALTLYDMLKPHAAAEDLAVDGVRLLEKTGGKSDYRVAPDPPVRAGVLVASDGVAAGEREDTAGRAIEEALEETEGAEVERREVLPDEEGPIRDLVSDWADEGIELILTVGGTGVSERDVTVEAVEPLLDPEIPGVTETTRAYGQRRMPFSMLSRGVAGMIGGTLVVTLPGSPAGARESFDAVFPAALHAVEVRRRGAGAHERG